MFGTGTTAVIMVNPSTADAEADDATIRKLRGFGLHYAWGRIIVGNLYAYRATDVRELSAIDDPIGPENDEHLATIFDEADQIIVAWGPIGKQPRAWREARVRRVLDIIGDRETWSLGEPAKDGHPRHPLMLSYANVPCRWSSPL